MIHPIGDFHPDHRRIFDIVSKSIKNTFIRSHIPAKFYSFDTYNSVGVNDYFKPDIIIDVTKEFAHKLKTLSMYKSQPVKHFEEMAISMGKIWGLRIESGFGEAFKINSILGIFPKTAYL